MVFDQRSAPPWCFDCLHVNYIDMRQAWAGILHQNQIPLEDAHAVTFSLCLAVFAFVYPIVTQLKKMLRGCPRLLAFFLLLTVLLYWL